MQEGLRDILIEYDDIWQDQKRFKALLSDYYPQDKMRRNLLYICVEEKIPEELLNADNTDNMGRFRCKNKLIAASGCGEKIADEIISTWIDALAFCRIKDQIRESPYDFIMKLKPERSYFHTTAEYHLLKEIFEKEDLQLSNRNVTWYKIGEVISHYRVTDEGFILLPEEYERDKEEELEYDILAGVFDLDAIDIDKQDANSTGEGTVDVEESWSQIRFLSTKLAASIYAEVGLYDKLWEEISKLEEAVNAGCKEDYSLIGNAYLADFDGKRKNVDKGIYWHNRLLDDVEKERVTISNVLIAKVCYEIGGGYYYKYKESPSTQYRDFACDYWKKAILYADGVSKDDVKEDTLVNKTFANDIYAIACVFFEGEIESEKFTDADYVISEKAFQILMKLGGLGQNKENIFLCLRTMYENGGHGLAPSMEKAELAMYQSMTYGFAEGISWCQKHFIDELPWGKVSNPKSILIKDLNIKGSFKLIHGLRIETLDDYKRYKFDGRFMNSYMLYALRNIKEYVESIGSQGL